MKNSERFPLSTRISSFKMPMKIKGEEEDLIELAFSEEEEAIEAEEIEVEEIEVVEEEVALGIRGSETEEREVVGLAVKKGILKYIEY